MGFLSNLFSRGRQDEPLRIETVTPERLLAATVMVLSGPRDNASTETAQGFLDSAKARGLDLAHMRVALRGKHLSYAVLPSLIPGRTLMLICGTPRSPQQQQDARALIEHVLRQYAEEDLALIQTLLEVGDVTLAGIFRDLDFCRLAELIYLEAPAQVCQWRLPRGFDLRPYHDTLRESFKRAIVASYQNTLDCPAINNVRTPEDVLISHRMAGEFDPANWLLLRHEGRPAGVLLLAKIHEGQSLELVYIGLAEEARKKGIASELVKLALTRAWELSCERLTTAVDANNSPAMRLYFRAGMQRIGSRLAMVRVIHRAGENSSTIHPHRL